jgi:hypothetical protein
MLQSRHIWKRGGLARRVLRKGLGIVYNAPLYGMVIYCIGCVIPTPLDRAPAEMNFQPAFVTSRVQPPFGPASESVTSPIALSIAATDPNPDDTLKVRLFVPSPTAPGGLQFLDVERTLTKAPDADDPNLRVVSLEPFPCINAMPGKMFDVYAVVADRDFTGVTATSTGGLTDQNHWELTCM